MNIANASIVPHSSCSVAVFSYCVYHRRVQRSGPTTIGADRGEFASLCLRVKDAVIGPASVPAPKSLNARMNGQRKGMQPKTGCICNFLIQYRSYLLETAAKESSTYHEHDLPRTHARCALANSPETVKIY
jgi:hypothetical protein